MHACDKWVGLSVEMKILHSISIYAEITEVLCTVVDMGVVPSLKPDLFTSQTYKMLQGISVVAHEYPPGSWGWGDMGEG